MCNKPKPGTVYHFSIASIKSTLGEVLGVPPSQIDVYWDLKQDDQLDSTGFEYIVSQMVVTILPEEQDELC